MSLPIFKRHSLPVLITLLSGLWISILACYIAFNNLKVRTQSDFHKISLEWSTRIESQIFARVQMLRSIQAFFAASEEVSKNEFEVFVQSIQSGYPSLFQIGWAPIEKNNKLPIKYLVGVSHGALNINFDLASNEQVKANIQMAIDSGNIIPIPCPDQFLKNSGPFVLSLIPIFSNTQTLKTQADRQANFIGLAFSLSNVASTVEKALSIYNEDAQNLELGFYHSAQISTENRLYLHSSLKSSENISREILPPFYTKSFTVAQSTWTIATYPTPNFLASHNSSLPWYVLGVGILLSILASGYVSLFFKRQIEIENLAREKLTQLETHITKIAKIQAINQFVTGMVHELNNPLSVVCSNAQFLLDKLTRLTLPENIKNEIEEELKLIQAHAKRCSDITAQFFSLSHQNNEDNKSSVDINECVTTIRDLLNKQLTESSISTQLELQSVPLLPISQSQLEQVLVNIFINAIHAMPEGGKLLIKSFQNSGQEIVLSLSDTGHGIQKEHMDKIFEPFFTTKAPGKGVGLGLAVCQNIIKNFGGHIEIKSTLNKGTIVEIIFPNTHS